MYEINLIAIIAASIGSMIFAGIWYMPKLFGNMWMRLSGIEKKGGEEMKKMMIAGYTTTFFMGMLRAAVLFLLIFLTGATAFGQIMLIAFLTWAGFALSGIVTDYVWQGKSGALMLLDTMFVLFSNIIIVLILTLFI